jgi:8-oxo-(d)GTP phosphatase
VVTSPSRRCRQTVEPFAGRHAIRVEQQPQLSEQGASRAATAALLRRLARRPEPIVVCTHRPVVPLVLAGAIAGDPQPDPTLPAAAVIVLHRGRDGSVIALERQPG